jgi:hypothetical protein
MPLLYHLHLPATIKEPSVLEKEIVLMEPVIVLTDLPGKIVPSPLELLFATTMPNVMTLITAPLIFVLTLEQTLPHVITPSKIATITTPVPLIAATL